MRLFWILAVCCLAVSALIEDENTSRVNGENGWYIPSVNGSFVWIDKDIAETSMADLEMKESRFLTTTPVSFYLYTQSNAKNGKKITTTTKSVDKSNFNATHPTRFVIHGFSQSYLSSINKDIRRAWLSKGDYNVIFVDWPRARSLDYASSVMAVSKVGKKVATMIDFLVKNYNMSLETLVVIGHSLGAHVAGYSGKNVKTGKIHTIVGLDPALPLFSYNKPKKRLADTDAVYVETIHTNGGVLGFLKPIGKGSFYPNGGKTQPGCICIDIAGVCDHSRSVTYYAEAVANDNFVTIECKNYQDAVANKCGSDYSSVRMGALNKFEMDVGVFYVPVNKKSPFGMLS